MENVRTHAPTINGETQIVEPDLDNLDPWLKRYVTEPFMGYQDIRDTKTGQLATPEQQLEASRQQLSSMVKGNLAAGMDPQAIKNMLRYIVTPEPPVNGKP